MKDPNVCDAVQKIVGSIGPNRHLSEEDLTKALEGFNKAVQQRTIWLLETLIRTMHDSKAAQQKAI